MNCSHWSFALPILHHERIHDVPYSIQHRLHHWRVHHLQVYLLCEYSTVTYNTLQYTTQTPPLTSPPPTGLHVMWVFHCYIQCLTVYNTDSSTDESTTYRFTCYVSIPLLHTILYSVQHRLLHWRIHHLQVYMLCEYSTVTYNTLQCTTQTPPLTNPPPTGLPAMWVFHCYIQYLTVYNTDSSTDESTTYRFTCYVSIPLLHTIPYSVQHRLHHWRIHHLQVYMLCEYSTVTYNTLQYTTQTPLLTNPPPTGLPAMWVFILLHTTPYSVQHRLLYWRIHHLQVYLLCEYSTVTYNTLQCTTQTPPLTNPPPTGLHVMWVFHCYIQYLTVYNTDASTDESTTYRFTCYVSIPLLHTIPYSIQHRRLHWRIHHLQVYMLCEYSTVTYNTLQYTTQTPPLTNPPPTGLHVMWVFHCYIQYLTVYNTDSSTDESTTYRFTCYVSIPLLHTIPYSVQHRLHHWRIHHLQVYLLCEYSAVTYNTLQCTTQTPPLTNPPPTGLPAMWVFRCYIQYLTVYNTDASTDESTTYRFTCYVSIPLLHTIPYSVQHRLLYWRIHHLQVYLLCEYSAVTYNTLQYTTQTPLQTNPPPTGLPAMWVFHCYIQYLTVYNTDSSTDESTTYRFTCYVSIPLLHTIPYSIQHRLHHWRIHHLQVYLLCEYSTVTYNTLQCTTQTPLLTNPPPTGLPAMWVFHCYIQYLTVYNTDSTTDESTTYRFTCYVSIPLLHTIPYSIQHRLLYWRIHHLQVYLLCEYSTVTYNTLQYTTQTPLLTNPPPTGLPVMWVFHCYIQYLTVYNTDSSTDESTTYRFTCYVSIPLLHTIPYSIQHRLHHWRIHHLQVYMLCKYSTVTYNTLQYTTQTPLLTNQPPTGLHVM